jgi:hypothetical protein
MPFVNAGEKRILINVLAAGPEREQLLSALAADAACPISRLGPMLQLEMGQLGPFMIRLRVHAFSQGEGPILAMERVHQLKDADAIILAGAGAEAIRRDLAVAGRADLTEVVWKSGEPSAAAARAVLKPVLTRLTG